MTCAGENGLKSSDFCSRQPDRSLQSSRQASSASQPVRQLSLTSSRSNCFSELTDAAFSQPPEERSRSERARLAEQVTILVPGAATRDRVLALLYEVSAL